MRRTKVTVIIQARMGSSRLPSKVFKEILGKPVLWHVLNRVKQARYINEIIVATTENEKDDEVFSFCIKNNISVFRGSENDVLDRYYKCAKQYKCENIVRITADCPLHDPQIIDNVINKYINSDYDYVTNTIRYTYPDGMDVEVFSFEKLEEAWKNAKLISEREHVTPYIRNSNHIKKFNVEADKKYPIYRLTLDCQEDYLLIKNIYERLGKDIFSLDDIMKYLSKHDELLNLNKQYEINEGYKKSLLEDKIYKNL